MSLSWRMKKICSRGGFRFAPNHFELTISNWRRIFNNSSGGYDWKNFFYQQEHEDENEKGIVPTFRKKSKWTLPCNRHQPWKRTSRLLGMTSIDHSTTPLDIVRMTISPARRGKPYGHWDQGPIPSYNRRTRAPAQWWWWNKITWRR